MQTTCAIHSCFCLLTLLCCSFSDRMATEKQLAAGKEANEQFVTLVNTGEPCVMPRDAARCRVIHIPYIDT